MLILAAGVSYGLYQLKYEVRDLERRADELADRIETDSNAIKVLSTEYSYLARPERLQSLSDRFLDLASPAADQITTPADLPTIVNDRVAGVGAPGNSGAAKP